MNTNHSGGRAALTKQGPAGRKKRANRFPLEKRKFVNGKVVLPEGMKLKWENSRKERAGTKKDPKLERILARAPFRKFRKEECLKHVMRSGGEKRSASYVVGGIRPSMRRGTKQEIRRGIFYARKDAMEYLMETPKGIASLNQIWRHLVSLGYDFHAKTFGDLISELVDMGAIERISPRGVSVDKYWEAENKAASKDAEFEDLMRTRLREKRRTDYWVEHANR
jgi:hypothetical protein